jgi:hypothetical protein
LAAILSEEAEKLVHDLELRRIDHRPAFSPHCDEAGVSQAVEMECERVRCKLSGLLQLDRRAFLLAPPAPDERHPNDSLVQGRLKPKQRRYFSYFNAY